MKNRFLALAGALSILSTVAVAPKAAASDYTWLDFDVCDGTLGLCTDNNDAIDLLDGRLGLGWEEADSFDGLSNVMNLGFGGRSTGLGGAGVVSFNLMGNLGYTLYQTDNISTINNVFWDFMGRFGIFELISSLTVYTQAASVVPPAPPTDVPEPSLMSIATPTDVSAMSVATPTDVPEPMTMIGSAIAVGFGSLVLKKGNPKKSAK
ncbi:MAG: PEP-CTERM sorting domain-containing protein [Arthrospira sp. SH-MAG29]|nr:PEP-CTERM sorting domain-containing protein [Arthrospira sp. SH-MAG29]MBS0015776.1 PEP-CTERM sorting domain-containing protein [Arthrospira sp. SH-MAG29]